MEASRVVEGDPALTTASGPRPSPGPSRSWSGRIERALFLLGFTSLAAVAAVLVEAGLYQRFQHQRLDGEQRHRRSGAASVLSGDPRLVGRIEGPRIGLSAIIREGIDRHTLMIAAGHVPGTALPGEDGNVVVSGHRDTFFRALRKVRIDDRIAIVTRDGEYHYRVTGTEVTTPDRTEILRPTEEPTLTLITCYPFGYIGPAPKRFVVRALRVPSHGPSFG